MTYSIIQRLNQSLLFYIGEYLLIEFVLFLLDHLFLFLGLGFLDQYIERILFLIIHLIFLFGIEEIVPDELGDICDESQFGDLEERDHDEDDEDDDGYEYADDLGS